MDLSASASTLATTWYRDKPKGLKRSTRVYYATDNRYEMTPTKIKGSYIQADELLLVYPHTFRTLGAYRPTGSGLQDQIGEAVLR